MTARASGTRLIGRALTEDTLLMTEQETQRVVVMANQAGVSPTMAAMCAALDVEMVIVSSHHDLPFRLHHHRPMAVISELEPAGHASCAALRSIAAYDPRMPVMVVSGSDPAVAGTLDAAEKLWGLSAVRRLPEAPAMGDLIGFLFAAGRHAGIGRLIPLW